MYINIDNKHTKGYKMFMFLIGFVVLTIVTIWWLVEVIADKMYGALFNKRNAEMYRKMDEDSDRRLEEAFEQLRKELNISDEVWAREDDD